MTCVMTFNLSLSHPTVVSGICLLYFIAEATNLIEDLENI